MVGSAVRESTTVPPYFGAAEGPVGLIVGRVVVGDIAVAVGEAAGVVVCGSDVPQETTSMAVTKTQADKNHTNFLFIVSHLLDLGLCHIKRRSFRVNNTLELFARENLFQFPRL
jgi:hypothetical protein